VVAVDIGLGGLNAKGPDNSYADGVITERIYTLAMKWNDRVNFDCRKLEKYRRSNIYRGFTEGTQPAT